MVYRAGSLRGKDRFFSIESAGEDLPTPEYLVERTRTKNDSEDIYANTRDNIYVFEYVLSGKGYIECEGKTYTVGAGDFYFLHRLHTHLYYADKTDPYRKLWVNASGRLMDSVLGACSMTDGALVVHDSQTLPYFRRIHELLDGMNGGNSEEIMNACAKELCGMILTASAEHKKAKKASYSIAEQIKDYIDSDLSFTISLDDIANRFFLNRSYIISIFSAKYGYTPKQYIIEKKMQSACSMLEENLYSIADIADILNFSSSQHFSAAFKKKYGMTPAEYRREKIVKS